MSKPKYKLKGLEYLVEFVSENHTVCFHFLCFSIVESATENMGSLADL
ncbi:hypothetical protein VCRA2122O339_160054 [Vibrio crassostreae]|nr:hypothetical protein VCRA2127O345_160086 [Vibrio crassostreae]CAK3258416.1 hypothetical protein VCRA2120E330_170053 [Vibrio crassostreae]CAK3268577.1 hypothetical protein VCRA2122O339_160054 [Vibrio crassostreae]CAK3272114.1 hypothetical protein VCRA2122O338_160055 [Vibrio crassostreae]CAK3740448.1 hypothetical protein VCRA2121O337_170083 [Vibrio crassostreae]